MKYTVYFELYGKKMKVQVDANNKEDAKYKVMGKIKWHKIVGSVDFKSMEDFNSIFGGIFKGK